MRSSKTFTILFWVYAKRAKEGFANLYVRITVNGKKANISMNKKIDVNLWDAKSQKMTGKSNAIDETNFFLNEVRTDIMQCYRELRLENETITAESLKARFLGVNRKEQTLKDIIAYHNTTMEHKLRKNTLGHYKTTQRYVLQYLKERYHLTDILLHKLDYAFALGFESYLRNMSSGPSHGTIGNNTAMKHIQRLRKMVTLAYHMEWIDRDPFIKYKLKFQKKEREYLSTSELQAVLGFKVPIERLNMVRDIFLFSCYTGMSYVDIANLKMDNIQKGVDGKQWIMFTRKKTGVSVKIPVLSIAKLLIEKYRDYPKRKGSQWLLPSISNQKLNSYLKEIADLCGITKNLTFHMARHTFATTVTLSNGVPIETVSKILGHTKITTTQIYARVVEKKVSEDIERLEENLSINYSKN